MTVSVQRITKGLDLPIGGAPQDSISAGPTVNSVALLGDDYLGMKPTMLVRAGDQVKLGQTLFEDKKNPGVMFTSPAAGTVVEVRRGAKRKFEALVIQLDGDDEETFPIYDDHHLNNLPREQVQEHLLRSGLWTALRTRPYSKIPSPHTTPHSLFVTAIETAPLAPNPVTVLREPSYDRYFAHGLRALSALTDGTTYLCKAANAELPGTELDCVTVASFHGSHPAGLAGTHIHLLDPVNEAKTVWYIGYQDVVAIGCLFLTGRLMPQRIISLAGPAVENPRLVRSRIGASIPDSIQEIASTTNVRIISGSVLSGRQAVHPLEFLGRFHQQISLISEGSQRDFLGWAMPGFRKFSVTRAFAAGFFKKLTDLPLTSSQEGSLRAIVPVDAYEQVMPLDIVATALLKALIVQDTETAKSLGCLELDEEDLALCTFVCPGKNAYGPLLRTTLEHIEREG